MNGHKITTLSEHDALDLHKLVWSIAFDSHPRDTQETLAEYTRIRLAALDVLHTISTRHTSEGS